MEEDLSFDLPTLCISLLYDIFSCVFLLAFVA